MCVVDSKANLENDIVKEDLVSGDLKRSDLQRIS
jgi:hypothetical protein